MNKDKTYIRKANKEDIDGISAVYEAIHDEIEINSAQVGWVRNVYPTKKTAEQAISIGDMFVLEEKGILIGAARLNKEQCKEYAQAHWQYDADPDKVMVMHTLVIHPKHAGKGYGRKFLEFYEEYALKNACPYLRIDTNLINISAQKLYEKWNYKQVGVISCAFNGIADVKLVCLEKYLS